MNRSKCILQINLDYIRENYTTLCNLCESEVAAVVKANAYGLGADHVAPALQKVGCKHFFASSFQEGIDLRKTLGPDSHIYVFNGIFKGEEDIFCEYNLIPVLNHFVQVEIWQDYALKINKKLSCVIHINTGMYRLGMPGYEWEKLDVKALASSLDILYIISHLSSSEDVGNLSNKQQLKKFIEYTHKFAGIKRSFANSGGIFLGPDYHFDLVRPGAALYGVNSDHYMHNTRIKNPIKLLAPIIQLHELPPGDSVGYNSTYTNMHDKSCLIATIPIGYADGFSRAFSNKGFVYINGYKALVIGRVSMDLVTIDVSNIPKEYIFLGALVEVIGDNCTPDQIAKLSGTNGYEIITMLGDRYEKIYT